MLSAYTRRIDEPALGSFDAVTETASLTSRKCSCTLGSPLPAHSQSYDGFPVYRVLLERTSDQLVQSRKQKLQGRRLVRLLVAEDQIDSWCIAFERTTR